MKDWIRAGLLFVGGFVWVRFALVKGDMNAYLQVIGHGTHMETIPPVWVGWATLGAGAIAVVGVFVSTRRRSPN